MPDRTGRSPVTIRPLSRDDFPLLQPDAGPSALYALTRPQVAR